MHDLDFLYSCLAIAERGRGTTGINPLVGAVLVRDGKIIAEGWHEEYGGPHAEPMLLTKFTSKIWPTDRLFVNIEPCCHQGKTPPCTDILIKKGVKKVVFGMFDPNPLVRGKGVAALRKAGVEVIGPIASELCRRRNRGFVSIMEQGRPWITLKKAQTIMGKIANDDGSRLCMTSPVQNEWSHTYLRSRLDAILVGVQTIVTDNPQLNTRFVQEKNREVKNPLRIVLDTKLSIPLSATVVSDSTPEKTLIVTTVRSGKTFDELTERGVKVLVLPEVSIPKLCQALITPQGDFNGISSILVEGGPKTWDAFKEAGAVDEEMVLVGSEVSCN